MRTNEYRDTNEERLRDFIRRANENVWEAYLLMKEQAYFNSVMIDSERNLKHPSRRTYRIKKFARKLRDLNGAFCGEFKMEIYKCACSTCLKR